MIIRVLQSRNTCIIVNEKHMIYINYPVYNLHDVPNALFLNKNIDDYSCDFHFCVHFFIAVINTRGVQRDTSTG